MFDYPIVPRRLLALLLLVPATSPGAWETVALQGHDYVTARSIKDFYGFHTMKADETHLRLESHVVLCRLPLEGTEATFNNVRFHLPFPLVKHEERYLVSRITLAKLIDPVLRPNYIRNNSRELFDTIVLDYDAPREKDGLARIRQLARDLQALLIQQHFKVVLVPRNEHATIKDRLATINAPNHALVLSLRLRLADRADEGIRTWVLAPMGVSEEGQGLRPGDLKALPGNDHDGLNIAIATALHGTALLRTKRPDRGVAYSRDPLLTGSKHPTIALEVGNLANGHEDKLLQSEVFRTTFAKAISSALSKAKRATTDPRQPRG